jgi:exosortase
VEFRGRARIVTTARRRSFELRRGSPQPLAEAALVAAAATALVTLYARAMIGLAREWSSSPDASYGILLVLVAVAIAWQRRGAFAKAAEPRASSHGGLVALLIGLCVYLVGLFGADVFLTRISFVVVIAGTLWFLAGWRAVRTMAAPLVFLLVAMPLPSLVVNTITLPMQLVASRVAESALTLAAVPVFRDGNVLMLPSTTLEVAEACSGLRSLVSLGAIAAVLVWAGERSPWRGAALLLLTVPVAIAMNGLRIAATAIACETWGPNIASGGWHTFTGWITFVVSILVLRVAQAFGPASGGEAALKGCATQAAMV